MPPRKKPGQPGTPTLTIGAGALVAGALYLLVYLWRTYPREVCAVGEVLCREHRPSPVVPIAPLPEGLVEDQVPAVHGCPRPSVQIDQHPGCWLPVDSRPPCGVAVEWNGRCWTALIVKKPLPAVQQPWNRR